MYMCRSLYIFSNVNFKMAARLPYWIFLVSGLTLVWLWISTPNFSGTILMYMGKSLLIFSDLLDFSVSGWHGFGSVTQVCFGISVSNFMCMSFVAVGRSLTIVSYVAFKMAVLWFWTMFNCNPPIAHCHLLLWGGGILVDHWSTISSSFWCSLSAISRGCCSYGIAAVQQGIFNERKSNKLSFVLSTIMFL